MYSMFGNNKIKENKTKKWGGRIKQQGAVNKSAISSLFFGVLLPLWILFSVYQDKNKPPAAEQSSTREVAQVPICKIIPTPYNDIPEAKDESNKKGFLIKSKWYMHGSGEFNIPIRNGSMRLVTKEWLRISRVCDYGEGWVLDSARFAFAWVNGELFTVSNNCPTCTQEQLNSIVTDRYISRIEIYGLSGRAKAILRDNDLKLNSYANNKYYQPAYQMKNLPLLYYPNFNFDNKNIPGIYLGIKDSIDIRSGYPVVIKCQLTTLDKRLDGDRLLPQARSIDMPIESIINATVSKYQACSHNYFLFIKNGQEFKVRIDLDAQLTPYIDKIFKEVERKIASYLVPVGEPVNIDLFNFNHGE